MISISLCMIVKNEEAVLARCLASAEGVADEIVIADTGSTDATKEVAASFGARVYDFAWADDFSAARNFSFSKAAKDYILWLDADDVLLEGDRQRLMALKETLEEGVDVVMMRYDTAFDESGAPTFTFFRERLVKRARGFLWEEPVHEFLRVYGEIREADIHVTHQKPQERERVGRNIGIYEKRLAQGLPLSPRSTYYYARELSEAERYEEAAERFSSFLDGKMGWVEDNITACGELARCFLALKREDEAFRALYRSFCYDTPRAELCCRLGYAYMGKKDYRRAVFWFSMVERLEKPENAWGFLQRDCWDYTPFLECAVCCDRLGLYEEAERYNELAAAAKPAAPAVLHNRAYFNARREERERKE